MLETHPAVRSFLDTVETTARAGTGRVTTPTEASINPPELLDAEPEHWADFLADVLPNPPLPPPAGGAFCPVLTPPTAEEEEFWHGSWKGTRRRLLASFERTGQSAGRINAFRCCGGESWVMKHKESGDRRIRSNRCHDRFCLVCQRARSRLIAGNVRAALTGRYYLHVVLTQKHRPEPLAASIDRLYTNFSKLRKSKVWKRHCHGGAFFLEVTRNDTSHTWHVHAHIIAQARFIPHTDYQERHHGKDVTRPGLRSTWLKVTGDSEVVWIRSISDKNAAAAEVSKYVTKPLSPSLFHDDDALDEFVTALKGRRLCATFGCWYRIKLTERSADFNPADWEHECSLSQLLERASQGEEVAKLLLEKFAGVLPCRQRPPPPGQLALPFAGGPAALCAPPTFNQTPSLS